MTETTLEPRQGMRGRTYYIARWGLLVGLASAAALVFAVLIRYPLNLARNVEEIAGAVAGLVVLAALGGVARPAGR